MWRLKRQLSCWRSGSKLNGFYGLDFIREEGTGTLYLIELNPRCTQLGHLNVSAQGDLAGALSARLKAHPQSSEEPIENDTIAFFPQAFNRNPQSPYLVRGYHDVPWTEPNLVRHLLKEPWPDRQLLARLYHFFRSPRRPEEVTFDIGMREQPSEPSVANSSKS